MEREVVEDADDENVEIRKEMVSGRGNFDGGLSLPRQGCQCLSPRLVWRSDPARPPTSSRK